MWMGLLLIPVLGHGQSWQWATYANSAAVERGAGIDVDKRTGDVYVCGGTAGALNEWGLPGTTADDGWVAKFKPNGTLIWAFLVNGAGNAVFNDIVVDSATQRFYVIGSIAGNTTLTGTSGLSVVTSASTGTDVLVACFDSAGVLQWHAVEGGPGNDLGSGLSVDATGLYISGVYQTSITLDGAVVSSSSTLLGLGTSDWFAARYNKVTGGMTWAVGNTAGTGTSRANAIATDPTGTDVYVVGGFSGLSQTVLGTLGSLVLLNSSAGTFDMWACALRKTDGLAQWGYAAGAAANDDEAFGVTSDAGAVFTTGRCQGNPTFAPLGPQPSGTLLDAFVARHNPANGGALWVNIMGSGGPADLQTVNDICPDGKGNLVLSGFFSGSINLPSNASVSATLASAGGTDLLLASINPAGGLVWSTQGGGAGSMDGSSECAAFDDKMAYVTGAYANGNSQFATAPVTILPLGGQEDVLVAKYGQCSLYVNPVNTLSSPSPGICSGGTTTVDLSTSQNGAFYQLVDSATGLTVGLPVAGTGGFLSLPTGILNTTTTFYVQGYFVNPACAEFLNGKVRIVVYPNPSVNIGPDITQCGGFGPLLDAGPGFSSYAWSTFQFTQTTIVTSSGTYSVTVTDANGCQASDTMVYVVHALPNPNLAPDRSICPGSTAVLNPGAGFTAYNWSTGATTPTLTVGTAGTYTVTVTDANGCTNSDQIVISVYPLPTVNIGPDQSVCAGSVAIFDAGPGFSGYAWSTGATTSGISPTTSGTYTVTVTDVNGCTVTDAAVLTVFANPTVTLGNDTAICSGNSLLLNAGGGFTSYAWSTGANTNPITVSAAGTYEVTVTDPNGCHASDSVLVGFHAQPTVNLGPDTSICPGSTFTFSVVGAFSGYAWSTGATTASITVGAVGSYDVTATDANGCQASDAVVLSHFALPVVALGNDTAICPLDSILLDAGMGQSGYLWNSGATTQTIQGQSAGAYQVTVTDANGCQAADTLVISHLPYPVVQLGADTIACQGTTLTLDAGNPGNSFLWNTGATTQTIATSIAGTFAVTVTPALGCPIADTIHVLFSPVPLPNLPAADTACMGDTLLLDPGAIVATYLWSTGATTQTILVSQGGPYAVTVTDTLGCTASDSMNVVLLNPPVVALGPDSTICQGDSLLLSVPNTGVTLLWSTGSTSNAILASNPGPYFLVATDGFGCQGSDTMTLALEAIPVVLLGGDRTICAGDSIPLDAGNPGLSFQWSNGATSQVVFVSQAATYTVTVSTVHGCTAADSMTLQLQALPAVNIGADTTLCAGDSLVLVNGTGFSGNWSDGSSNPSIVAAQSGWIWLQVSDNLGCSSRDSLLLSLQALPVVTLSGLAPQYCLSDPAAQLTGQPSGGNFSGMASGSGRFDPSIAGTGNHLVVYAYTDALGCPGSDSLSTDVVAPPSVADAGSDLFVGTEANLQAMAPTIGTGHWDIGAFPGQFSNPLSPTATASLEGNGSYPFVWITENAPCPSSMDTVWVVFEGMHIPTGFSPNGDGVNDEYVIRGIEGFPNTRLQVLNRWGQVLWHSDDYHNDWTGQGRNGEPLVEDTYYVIVRYGDQEVSTYVVLKR